MGDPQLLPVSLMLFPCLCSASLKNEQKEIGKPVYCFCTKSEEAEINFTFRGNNSEIT